MLDIVNPTDNDQYVNLPNAQKQQETEMNNHVQYRGLPPPPLEDFTFAGDTSIPPPCPREMYSQPGIYDVIPGQQEHYSDHRKAPPPPRRNPDTRLSRSNSTSSDTHDAAFTNDHNGRQSQHSPVHSPRQSPMSPRMQVRHSNQPLSPSSNTSKPFSYITNLPGSPKQKRRTSETCQYDVPDISPSDPTYEPIGQPVHYTNGQARKSHVITGQEHFHGQRVSPVTIQGHMQMSPKAQRKSSKAMSPILTRKHSDKRNKNNNIIEGQGTLPPSFPAPPPPLPVTARFVAAIVEPSRSPSPPLPPPPPELGHHSNDQPPPPPPISKIPGRSTVSSFELGKKTRPESTPIHPANIREHSVDIRPESVAVPLSYSKQPQMPKSSFADELSNAKLKMTQNKELDQNVVINQNFKNGNQQGQVLAAEIGKIKLTPVSNKDKTKTSPDQDTDSSSVIKPKLRPTGPKPWEKEQQLAQHSTNITDPPDDQLPLPPPPPPDTELPPPPPPDLIASKPVEIVTQSNGVSKAKTDKSQGSKQSLSGMEDINLDEIDVSQIPGYTVITAAVPNWKRDVVDKKNKQLLDEYIKQLQKKKAEAEKWKNIPEWKRKLMEEKEKQKEQEESAKTEALKQQAKAEKEADRKKQQERRQQLEREEQMREELADVPEWKREIMIKRGGELKNWGDEREEENKDD